MSSQVEAPILMVIAVVVLVCDGRSRSGEVVVMVDRNEVGV